ncbi:MAG: polysaccharide deacetylase family protein [Eubacterium sp.]|nr:polysaccharide deacetylase family protein [Eubacterium sp.]
MSNDRPLRVIYTCFPGGRHKVLTMSYDDGRIEDRRLVEIFNKYGIKGTFNLNSFEESNELENKYLNERIPVSEYKELYKGHEVACHTSKHPTIARCPDEQNLMQVLENRRDLERAVGYTVRGLAYPNGSVNEKLTQMLPYAGIRYGRTVKSTMDFAMPDNYMLWNPTAHHNNPDLYKLGEKFKALFKTQYLYLMYVWGHSYEFTDKNNWDVIEGFCQQMGGREDIWYATNIDIYDYMTAASELRVSVDGDFAFNPTAYDIWIEVDRTSYLCKSGEKTMLL